MNISVVIPTYNREQQVIDLIEYLIHDIKFRNQIVIVDQNDSKFILQSNYQNVERHFLPDKGTGKARNFGANQSNSDWICFLDDDVRPIRDFFERASSLLEVNPWIDVLQPEILQREAWTEYRKSPTEWMLKFKSTLAFYRNFPPSDLDGIQWFMQKPNTAHGVLSLRIGAGAFFIKRDVFFRVEGFDETLTGSGDDSDLAIRLWWHGYRTYYYPQVVAFHLHSASGGLRESKSKTTWLNNLFRPEPNPGVVYFYKKWFPGFPAYSFYVYYLLKNKKQLFFPVKLLRLMIAIRSANKLITTGAQYINHVEPKPRMELGS